MKTLPRNQFRRLNMDAERVHNPAEVFPEGLKPLWLPADLVDKLAGIEKAGGFGKACFLPFGSNYAAEVLAGFADGKKPVEKIAALFDCTEAEVRAMKAALLRWTVVSFPAAEAKSIGKMARRAGFTNMTEFVRSALREKIEARRAKTPSHGKRGAK